MTTRETVKALRETESRSKRELLDETERSIEDLACVAVVLAAALQIIEDEKMNEQERKELCAVIQAGLRHLKNVHAEIWK